jgi:hypothetical protein
MKVEIEIPSNLSEISLDRYQKYMLTLNNSDDKEFVFQKMIEIFCGLELKEVVKMKASTVIELVQHFDKLFNEKTKFKHRFKLNNVEFGFIPDLEEISWGEYIDIESNVWDFQNIHKALAVMYRPIVKDVKGKYEIEPYKGDLSYAEVLKYAPLDVVLPASVFFWTLGIELISSTLSSLEKTKNKTHIQRTFNSQNNGDGIAQSITSLKETLEDLKKLQRWDFISA